MVSNSRIFDVVIALAVAVSVAWGIVYYGQYAQLRFAFLYPAAWLLLSSVVALKRRVDYLARFRLSLRSIKIKRQKILAEICGLASVLTLAVNLFSAYAVIDQHAFRQKYSFLGGLEKQFDGFLTNGKCGGALVDQCNELKLEFIKVKGAVYDESKIEVFEKDVLVLERHLRSLSEKKVGADRDALLEIADSLHALVPINDDFSKIRSVVVYTISMILALVSIYTKIAIAIVDAYGNWPVDKSAVKRFLARCDVFVGCSVELKKRSIRIGRDENQQQRRPSAYNRPPSNI